MRHAASGTWARRAVLLDHGVVVDESAGRQDHAAAGPDGSQPFVRPHLYPDDVPAVHDDGLHPGIAHHSGRAGRHCVPEALHEEATGGVDPLRLVAARDRRRDLVKGIGVLTATEEQPGVVGRLAVGLVAERRPEGHADGNEPLEVLDRAIAIGVDAVVVGPGPECGVEEGRHVLGRILEPAGVLQRCATAEVDQTAGLGRRPAGSCAPLNGQHVRTGLPRRHHCRGAGDAEAGDHDVGRLVEADLAGLECRDRLHRHFRSPQPNSSACCTRPPLRVNSTSL